MASDLGEHLYIPFFSNYYLFYYYNNSPQYLFGMEEVSLKCQFIRPRLLLLFLTFLEYLPSYVTIAFTSFNEVQINFSKK